MDITEYTVDGGPLPIKVIVPGARFDIAESAEFRKVFLTEDYAREGVTRIVLDLSKVNFLDSSGFGALIETKAFCEKHGGICVVCNLRETLVRMFQKTKLDQMFHVFPELDDAVRFIHNRLRSEDAARPAPRIDAGPREQARRADDREPEDTSVARAILPALLLTASGIWFIGGALLWFGFPNWETRGNFGEMFGVVEALFSGLAFAGIIYTILIQQKELSVQSRELARQRMLFEHQKESTVIQTRIQALLTLINLDQLKLKAIQEGTYLFASDEERSQAEQALHENIRANQTALETIVNLYLTRN